MVDKNVTLQIVGSLMKRPQFLSEIDKFNLTPNDFNGKFDKYIFIAIDNLYHDGLGNIRPIDVDNYLSTNQTAHDYFIKHNGIEYLQDALDLSEEDNFQYYYNKLKKINLLNSLNKLGIDTSEFYCENLFDTNALEINSKFEKLSSTDIIETVKKKILKVEQDYALGEVAESGKAFDNIKEILEDAGNMSDVGLPVQGTIFNQIISGARKGTLVVRSLASGVGKTRQSVGDACYLAYPIRYDQNKMKWVSQGSCEKALIIATEQSTKEIQRMVLAYLTGINETKFRYGGFTDIERKVINDAITLMEEFQDNLYIIRMPNPTIELVKLMVREHCIMYDISYVFYDYIFICPSLLNEFKGFNLRNDKILSYI